MIVGGATASALVGFAQGYLDAKKNKGRKETIEERISKLTGALKDSSRLVAEIESEIETRKQLVEELQEDAEKHRKLISMNGEQVQAIAQVLGGELRKESKKSFWKGVGVNFIFFLLGASASWLFSR